MIPFDTNLENKILFLVTEKSRVVACTFGGVGKGRCEGAAGLVWR